MINIQLVNYHKDNARVMIYTNQHLRMNYIELLSLDYYFQGVYIEFE